MKNLTPTCPACLDTALVPRDGSPRVLTHEWVTLPELRVKYKPCPFCPAGAKEGAWQKAMVAGVGGGT
jgi:hypothetical protein